MAEGLGLIEVLIAVLIFTVGALGLASLQLAAKRNIYEATQRSIATSLARDILERMRANPGELEAYVAIDLGADILSPGPYCRLGQCTPGQLAASDLYDWSLLLRGHSELFLLEGEQVASGGLVSPRACITHVDGLVSIAIAWRGASEMANPTAAACGESAEIYGVDNARRRLLLMSTYIGSA